MELMQQQENLKNEIKSIKEEIKSKTKELQKSLQEKEKELKLVNEKVKKEIRAKQLDKSVHPMERFISWMNTSAPKSDWIIEGGPLRDTFFDDEYRYSTVYVQNRLWDTFYQIGYYIETLDNSVEINLYDLDEAIKEFDSWDEDSKLEVTAIMEDAIKQNVNEFTYDW